MTKYNTIIGVLTVVVVLTILVAMNVAGNPLSQRAINMDAMRLGNFSTISSEINTYYQKNHTLPDSLSQLPNPSSISHTDPESKSPYTYTIVSPASYKLCTIFSTDSAKTQSSSDYLYYADSTKTHKQGFDCLSYTLPAYLLRPTPYIPPVYNY